jgi:hypothetical protein
MSLLGLLIGRPIATTEERAEHIGPVAGIPLFGLDALSSAAYGPLLAGIAIWMDGSDRGRDTGYPVPPAQIRAGLSQALGSHLGCLTAKRSHGQG